MMRPMVLPMPSRTRPGFLLLLAALLSGAVGSSAAQAETPVPAAGATAPDFSREGLDHRPVALAAYRGKVVLLNFWATWCSPCLAEIPRFAQWQSQYGPRGLQVVGISMDDDAQPVRAAYQKFRLNYPVAMGDEKLGELYGGILGLPVTFLIDSHGQIRFRHRGGADLAVLQNEIESLLPSQTGKMNK